MICNKCNHTLLDDSAFCQYCGNKVEKNSEVSFTETFEYPKAKATEVTSVGETVAKRDSARAHKQRYCKFCGGEIDAATKQCKKCGKQYFRVKRKAIIASVQCLVVFMLVALVVFQYMQYKADIASLTEKVKNLDMQYTQKTSELKYLQNDLYAAESRLEFIDQYVVFMPLGESAFMDENEYHKQSCVHFKSHLRFNTPSDFCAMDVAMAEYMGYRPCPDCCD